MWHPFVTCGHCGHIHECVRLIAEPSTFSILCHGCEGQLTVSVTAAQIATRRNQDREDGQLEVRGAVTGNRMRS